MPRTAKITDGTNEVDLINMGATGIIASRGGLGPNRLNPSQTFVSSSLTDGAALRLKTYPPIPERYTLNLKDTTQDAAATQLQTLARLLRKADNLQLTRWQQTPVYIEQSATTETNTRFSLVIAWISQELSDYFNFPFEADTDFDEFEIVIVREPFWRGTAPGVLSSLEPIKTPDFPYFDIEIITGDGAINVTAAAAQTGDWGVAFSVGTSDTAFGIIRDPNNLTEFSIKFEINSDDLVMSSGDSFRILRIGDTGASPTNFIVELDDNAGARRIKATLNDDAPSSTSTAFHALPESKSTILIEWKASTGPGNDDGELRLSIDGDLKETLSGVDNDTYAVDFFQIGAVLGVDAGTTGDLYMDTIAYDDASPFSSAFRTVDFEPTIQFVSNFRQTGTLSHIFMEDNSLAAFSANLAGEPSFPYFEVSGSTPAVDDAAYFLGDDPIYKIVLNIGVRGNTNVTILTEYSTAAGWTAFSGMLTGLLVGTTGHLEISFNGASDYAARLVNGVTKFGIRFRISVFTSWTTTPEQADEIVHLPNNTYYEFNSSQLHGDVQALTFQRLVSYGSESPWARVIFGTKSRGLANFTSRLNAGGQNPTDFVENYGTDTAQTADPTAPGGNNATCDFSTNQTNVERLNISIASIAIERDFEGVYRIYMRAKQVNGSVGDVSVQLKVQRTTRFDGEIIKMKQVDEDFELLDMGLFSIQNFGVLGDEVDAALGLVFRVFASSSNGTTPDLEIWDLVLIPVDETAFVTTQSGRAGQPIAQQRGIQIDSGIIRTESDQFRFTNALDSGAAITLLSEWESRGKLPIFEPARNTQVHFVFGFSNNNITESPQGLGGAVQLRAHERWLGLRGLD